MVKMWEEICEQPAALKRCLETNREVINMLVEALDSHDISSVVIAARGTSDHAGIYGKYVIESTLGIPVALAAPSVVTVYGKSLKLKNSLVIGISQSGKAADVLEIIREGNKQGAITVAITNFNDSPLANEASYHLYTDAGLEKSVAATKTFTTQMYLLANLAAVWAKDADMQQQLSKVPDLVSKTLELSDVIKEKVQRYRYMNECFVLARGMNYSIAMETALKIQETCYVRARAYAVSDFHHGPFAMIDKDMPVILLAPEGPSLKDNEEMIYKLKDAGAELVIFSDKDEILELGTTSFRIPKAGSDLLSPFCNAVVAQMFACNLSLARGLNPDSPRGLNKVTITK